MVSERRPVPAEHQTTWPEVASCADPTLAEVGLARLAQAVPGALGRLAAAEELRRAVVDVMAASPFLARTCASDPLALDVLADLQHPFRPAGRMPLARWKALEVLRIAALDLAGALELEEVGGALADLASALVQAALAESPPGGDLVVVGMGKLGARELNYGSDIDIVLVGSADPHALLGLVRQAWRTDLDLRPEGRSGPLVRSLASYEAYWDRWAQTWEFQALLKARPIAGPPALGDAFAKAAALRVWGRTLGADDLRSLRAMKARAEQVVARRGLSQQEIKLGRGGIRDIEFAVQLLQMVHGRSDASLRVPATLDALAALATGGYVAHGDADGLAQAYRFLRSVEHRLQLFEDRQVHSLPADQAGRAHLARVMGYRDSPGSTALAHFELDLARHQVAARSIHERLFFRPLLELFSGRRQDVAPTALAPDAVGERLAAFGFSDATRTRDAVIELTQGFSRTSRLMQSMVPLLLDWLSGSPSPDLGLIGLRRLATGPHRRSQLSALFRESPETARRLCLLLGTGALFADGYERHPDQLALLADGPPPMPEKQVLERRAFESIAWRPRHEWWRGLSGLVKGEVLRAQARDVLGLAELPETARSLTTLAEAALDASLRALAPEPLTGGLGPSGPSGASGVEPAPVQGIAIVAMGRFGGGELAYASDLDVMVVFDDASTSPQSAEHVALALLQLVGGDTPVHRLYDLDMSLRPEGRGGPLARSLKAFAGYYDRWAQVWERQALTRARFVAGDPDVAGAFAAIAESFVWDRPLSEDDVTELRRMKARVERERVPAGEDPEFHLKLGPGSLSDVEWTVQLLQLRNHVKAEGTLDALASLVAAGAIDAADAGALGEAYRFCEVARNRIYLVRGLPGDSLPPPGRNLTMLAMSMGTTAPELRDRYRRLTRRARLVTEHLFYGSSARHRAV